MAGAVLKTELPNDNAREFVKVYQFKWFLKH